MRVLDWSRSIKELKERDLSGTFKELKERDWSGAVSTATFFIAVVVATLKAPSKNEAFKAILEEAIPISLLTITSYLAVKFSHVKKSETLASQLLHLAESVSENLSVGNGKLDQAAKQITDLSKSANTAIRSLEKTASEVISLDSLPEHLFDRLDPKWRTKITPFIDGEFRHHKQAWLNSTKGWRLSDDPAVAISWAQLVKVCLESGRPCNDGGEISTTSEAYTKAVTACLDTLMQQFPDKQITLFVVTAMLPEQFYNWPQVELSSHSYPEYISHTWEKSKDYLNNLDRLKDRVRIRRCILVKADSYSGDKLPFCGKVKDLRSSANLYICKEPITYGHFEELGATNLFQNTAKFRLSGTAGISPQYAPYESGKQLPKIDKFLFYPIGTLKEFSETQYNDSMDQLDKLLDKFIRELHSNTEDDVLYYPIRDTNIDKLSPLFSESVNLMPELAMFKIESESEPGHSWNFGLSGLLTPFTQTMCVRFLGGDQLAPYQIPLRYLESEADCVSTLLEPERLQQGFEIEYESSRTAWEELPCNHQSDFVKRQLLEKSKIKTILDIGCGRGFGTLTMLLENQQLNREGVQVLGVDFANNAIRDANILLQDVRAKGERWANIPGFPPKHTAASILCDVRFHQLDILNEIAAQSLPSKYDLVIDWMCLHELSNGNWETYAELITNICNKWFVLNVFTTGSTVKLHGLTRAAKLVPKHQLSKSDIESLFRRFTIIGPGEDYAEDIQTLHKDGPIAAKHAYLLKKIGSS